MEYSNLIRLSGLATMVGGVLFLAAPTVILGSLVLYEGPNDPGADTPFVLYAVAVAVALLLVSVGMVGFHALQRQSYGRIGLAGFWLVVIASLVVAFGVATLFIWGDLLPSVGGVLGLLVGFVLYGVATLRAKVLPRWCGVAFIALPVALVLSIPLSSFASLFVVFGLIWLALGYALWTRRAALAERPSRVR